MHGASEFISVLGTISITIKMILNIWSMTETVLVLLSDLVRNSRRSLNITGICCLIGIKQRMIIYVIMRQTAIGTTTETRTTMVKMQVSMK